MLFFEGASSLGQVVFTAVRILVLVWLALIFFGYAHCEDLVGGRACCFFGGYVDVVVEVIHL